jgi:hypothetical protein
MHEGPCRAIDGAPVCSRIKADNRRRISRRKVQLKPLV